MAYQLKDASGDVAIEAAAGDLGSLLVELGRAVAHVLTEGSTIRPQQERAFRLDHAGPDLVALAVAFVDEAIFAFDTDNFLIASGRLEARPTKEGFTVAGTLSGEGFDLARHRHGRGVKAVTFHDAKVETAPSGYRAHLMLDL